MAGFSMPTVGKILSRIIAQDVYKDFDVLETIRSRHNMKIYLRATTQSNTHQLEEQRGREDYKSILSVSGDAAKFQKKCAAYKAGLLAEGHYVVEA